MKDFKDGDLVNYKLPNQETRSGYIRGISAVEMPVIGRSMIIEDVLNFPTSDYKFTCFALPEIFIEHAI